MVETAEEPATGSTLSGEQALQLLKPGLEKKRPWKRPLRGASSQEEGLLERKLCQSGRFASARADEGRVVALLSFLIFLLSYVLHPAPVRALLLLLLTSPPWYRRRLLFLSHLISRVYNNCLTISTYPS